MMNRRHFCWLTAVSHVTAQTTGANSQELSWHEARTLTVEGLGFKDRKSPYDRLPARAEGVVRKEVWDLSRDSAGVLVRFLAETPAIHARWTITKESLTIPTMTAVASSGVDLYAKTDQGRWHWLSIGRPVTFPVNTGALANDLPSSRREYCLYFPLRNGVTSLEIGVPKSAAIAAAPRRDGARRSIVFYGTSITHGASASRAGMTHVAILGRRFDREAINLGFSGNGRMELEVAKFIAELDPAIFVIDCLPNMTAADVHARAEACIRLFREARPSTPILLVEDRNYADGFLNRARRERNETNQAALRAVYKKMQGENVPHLSYLRGEELLGEDGEDTIDGSHPTDLGFFRQAAAFEKELRKILS